MGFFRDLLLGPAASFATTGLLSWYSPQDSIQSLFVADALGDAPPPDTVSRDSALRVPAVKRAHDVICGVLADMPWVIFDNEQRLADQPTWTTTTLTGIPPRDLRWAVTSDLFMTGWAVIGFELGPDGLPLDALHIPAGMWSMVQGTLQVSDKIDPRYRQRVVPIRLGYGSNGILVDGHAEIADARSIATAYRDRIDNPIAQTILSVAAERWDGWTKEEREEFRQLWITGRAAKGGATAMKPDWVSVETSGSLPTDLFESGRNANRLDLANHAGLPASILEGAKQGSGSDIHYSTEANGAQRNELWDFCLSKYASAIAGRLSLDDVCAPGLSLRVDTSAYLTSPQPPAQQTSED